MEPPPAAQEEQQAAPGSTLLLYATTAAAIATAAWFLLVRRSQTAPPPPAPPLAQDDVRARRLAALQRAASDSGSAGAVSPGSGVISSPQAGAGSAQSSETPAPASCTPAPPAPAAAPARTSSAAPAPPTPRTEVSIPPPQPPPQPAPLRRAASSALAAAVPPPTAGEAARALLTHLAPPGSSPEFDALLEAASGVTAAPASHAPLRAAAAAWAASSPSSSSSPRGMHALVLLWNLGELVLSQEAADCPASVAAAAAQAAAAGAAAALLAGGAAPPSSSSSSLSSASPTTCLFTPAPSQRSALASFQPSHSPLSAALALFEDCGGDPLAPPGAAAAASPTGGSRATAAAARLAGSTHGFAPLAFFTLASDAAWRVPPPLGPPLASPGGVWSAFAGGSAAPSASLKACYEALSGVTSAFLQALCSALEPALLSACVGTLIAALAAAARDVPATAPLEAQAGAAGRLLDLASLLLARVPAAAVAAARCLSFLGGPAGAGGSGAAVVSASLLGALMSRVSTLREVAAGGALSGLGLHALDPRLMFTPHPALPPAFLAVYSRGGAGADASSVPALASSARETLATFRSRLLALVNGFLRADGAVGAADKPCRAALLQWVSSVLASNSDREKDFTPAGACAGDGFWWHFLYLLSGLVEPLWLSSASQAAGAASASFSSSSRSEGGRDKLDGVDPAFLLAGSPAMRPAAEGLAASPPPSSPAAESVNPTVQPEDAFSFPTRLLFYAARALELGVRPALRQRSHALRELQRLASASSSGGSGGLPAVLAPAAAAQLYADVTRTDPALVSAVLRLAACVAEVLWRATRCGRSDGSSVGWAAPAVPATWVATLVDSLTLANEAAGHWLTAGPPTGGAAGADAASARGWEALLSAPAARLGRALDTAARGERDIAAICGLLVALLASRDGDSGPQLLPRSHDRVAVTDALYALAVPGWARLKVGGGGGEETDPEAAAAVEDTQLLAGQSSGDDNARDAPEAQPASPVTALLASPSPFLASTVVPALAATYGDAERVGHYEKVGHRARIAALLAWLWGATPQHRGAFRELAAAAAAASTDGASSGSMPAFVSFAHGLVNHTATCVTAALDALASIRDAEAPPEERRRKAEAAAAAQAAAAAALLAANSATPTEDAAAAGGSGEDAEGGSRGAPRAAAEDAAAPLPPERLSALSDTATTSLALLMQTTRLLALLTSDPLLRRALARPELVDHLAGVLLRTIIALGGPRGVALKVARPARFGFAPRALLRRVLAAALRMGNEPAFVSAVAGSGLVVSSTAPTASELTPQPAASVTKEFAKVTEVVSRIGLLQSSQGEGGEEGEGSSDGALTLASLHRFLAAVTDAAVAAAAEEAAASDAPDALLDPLSFALMRDPVRTPSGRVYERASITQQVLNYGRDPFTNAPLGLSDLAPAPDVAAEVEAWLAAARAKAAAH